MMKAFLLCMVPLLANGSASADEEGFVSIFDGRSLAGWQGQDDSFWTIEDEAITGTIKPDHRPPMNQYLVWQGGLVEDFEIKLDYRHTGSTTPDTNGGFQYRSRRLPNGDVAGYQVDNNFGQPWRARLYDEFGRHDLALEGQEAWFSPTGDRSVKTGTVEAAPAKFRLDDWHEYHLSAIGPELTLSVNGRVIAVAHDGDGDCFEARGILAMQLHTGPTMKAQFKNIRLKQIRVAPADSRDAIVAFASLHWDLGERSNAHQPPLAPVGDITLTQVDNERVARMKQAHFHAQVDLNTPKEWNVPGSSMTTHLRGSIDSSANDVILWSKGRVGNELHFCWTASKVDQKRELNFSIRTDQGSFHVKGDAGVDGTMHDWIARYDGQTLSLWTDGEEVASIPAAGTLQPSSAPILIGAASKSENVEGSFTGDLEEISLWNQALTLEQIERVSP
ncbi:DUF1080 domain-containing protein [bacterium]|nr:DUF1080 domain-containing protein [bacterium]